ncbi:MAG: hypothetical protein JNJ58_09415 [Chitinophagaceae bacterium]|nr:hypothetical protein [Chitinophagaceae bacterium]
MESRIFALNPIPMYPLSLLLSLLLPLLLGMLSARADLPYHPLSYTLSTSKSAYLEGERIDFILTIRNNDEARTWPVITPGGQNSGQKVIYLRVLDPNRPQTIILAEESREMTMSIKSLGINGMEYLKPGEEIKIPFYWNDRERYLTHPEAHHAFNRPLFSGEFDFQAFYNPFGSGVGDSLYHLMNSTDDEQSATKLNFLGAELSQPLRVKILKAPPGIIHIQQYEFICKARDGQTDGQFLYYTQSINDTNLVHISNTNIGSSRVTFDYTMHWPSRRVEWINRREDGSVYIYKKRNENGCPTEYYGWEYQINDPNKLYKKVDTNGYGSIHEILYYLDGRIRWEQDWNKQTMIYTHTLYVYNKELKLLRKKKTESPYKIPCEVYLELMEGEAD